MLLVWPRIQGQLQLIREILLLHRSHVVIVIRRAQFPSWHGLTLVYARAYTRQNKDPSTETVAVDPFFDRQFVCCINKRAQVSMPKEQNVGSAFQNTTTQFLNVCPRMFCDESLAVVLLYVTMRWRNSNSGD